MKTSLIIPTLNEANCIARVLGEIPKNCVDEILVVDGHSTDGTAEIVQKLGYRVIQQDDKGFGDAFASGARQSTGDVLILMDGDGSHNPADIPRLLDKYKEGYDYVMASRYLPDSHSEDDTTVRSFGNWFFTKLVNLIHGLNVSDSLYLFTAIDHNLYKQLNVQSKGFEYCMELIIKAHKMGARFAEVPSIERKRFSDTPKTNALIHGWRILLETLKRVPTAPEPYSLHRPKSVSYKKTD
ncbi:MAG: glycosyltransferase family 2 protein [Deltaproteobacteria bacterium]|nr:glycosyltransferase family 2 protein [Deltaproteobacteria bacterium]